MWWDPKAGLYIHVASKRLIQAFKPGLSVMTCMEKVHVQRCTDNEFIYILRVFPHNTYSTLSALIHVHIMEDQVWWEGESTESMGGSPGDVSENPVA